jgi:hypothetical protein
VARAKKPSNTQANSRSGKSQQRMLGRGTYSAGSGEEHKRQAGHDVLLSEVLRSLGTETLDAGRIPDGKPATKSLVKSLAEEVLRNVQKSWLHRPIGKWTTYEANTIGVKFPLKCQVHWSGDGRKSYIVMFDLNIKPLTLLSFYLESKGFAAKSSKQGFVFGIGTIPASEWQSVPAQFRFSKNSCIVRTKYFKCEITFDLERDAITHATYTPIGTKEERRESETDFLKKAPPSDTRVKRIYRRASELPDPTQDHRAPVNRTKKQIALRLSPEMIELVDKAAATEGVTRNEWIENALESLIPKP